MILHNRIRRPRGCGDATSTVEKTRPGDCDLISFFYLETAMKFKKDTVYISADKLTTTDEDGKVTVVYAFPDPLPANVSLEDGKYYIEVMYVDPEVGDITFSEKYAAELPASIEEKDLVAACKSGIRLLLGDAAKEPFRVSGNGVKTQTAALSWACQPANMAHFETWQNTVKTSGKAKADEALLAAYHASR